MDVDHDDADATAASLEEGKLLLLSLLLLLQFLAVKVSHIIEEMDSLLVVHLREQRRLNTSLLPNKVRASWQSFVGKISADHFRRMFRMKLDVFNVLCQKIKNGVGQSFLWDADLLAKGLYEPEAATKSPPIAGEPKVAASIKMLAGGSYLDLIPLFGVKKTALCTLFGDFLEWIILTFEFPLVRWLREGNWEVLEHLARQFAESSNGVFYGPFCALDGLAARIQCPTLEEVVETQVIIIVGKDFML